MFLERRAFRDHETLEELFTIHSNQEQRAYQIHWRKRVTRYAFLPEPQSARKAQKQIKRVQVHSFNTRHSE